jgi:hypothetical protein
MRSQEYALTAVEEAGHRRHGVAGQTAEADLIGGLAEVFAQLASGWPRSTSDTTVTVDTDALCPSSPQVEGCANVVTSPNPTSWLISQ